jgi:outer membrane receptor for ferrienterochelin and colicins
MKKIIGIAIVLIATLNLKAQNQIKGRVVEKMEDGKELPIPGANVYWEGATIGVASDEEGFYLIPSPENYPATMVVSFVGYQAYTQVIKEWNHYHIYLQQSVELEEVKVKGKVNTTKFSTINTINMQTLSTRELEKAACCNLSESFSTNATVDVTFTDAVSGAKKIQMLGLDGVYTQITQENMPLIRGISSAYGLSYVPGTWIESIQIIKGAGSVVNGFESFAGQINLEYYKPESAPKLFWNAYTNSEGKLENNLLLAKKQGNWKSNLFTHISYFDNEVDHNEDNFLDVPKTKQVNVLNRWEYKDKNYHIGFTARALAEDREGGTLEKGVPNSYVVDIHNDLLEFTSKTGMKLPNSPGKSMGFQTSFRRHNQTAIFGNNDYKGLQESAYLNLIRQTYIGNSNHKLKYGTSYYADRYTESFSGNINALFTDKVRTDLMTGLFSEYSYNWGESFDLTAGLRADYYNNTEQFNYLPRLNMKYNPTENTAIRLSAGKAFRIANVLVENASFLASNRTVTIGDLSPEIAWNYGVNITHSFRLFGRDGTINADAYRTDFENQIVVDIEKQDALSFYNLDGKSYATSMQLDVAYEIFDKLDVKMAYKINEVKTTFGGVVKIAPLTPKTRGLFNLSYATNFDKWVFDVTANYIGESRIPTHELIDEEYSAPFKLYNAQVTKKFRKFDVYLGGENLLSYKQKTPILDAGNPSSTSSAFDASLIYAPVNGRMIYAGLRYKIK